MRNIFRTVAILVLLSCIRFAGIAEASLRLNDQTAPAGKEVTFSVSINTAPNAVKAFGLDIVFDANVLRYKKHEPGSLVQKKFSFFGVNEVSPGRLRIGGVENINKIKKGATGTLVLLTFEVIGTGKCEMKMIDLKDNLKNWQTLNGQFAGSRIQE